MPLQSSAMAERRLPSFTNEHAGCYALEREQLRRAISSGGFLLPPREGKYAMLETAATDIYTNCGFRKLISISRFQDFLVPHLSNKYAGKGVVAADEFFRQVDAMDRISPDTPARKPLVSVETGIYHQHWSKSYYEPCQDRLVALVPQEAKSVLSIGCGWGMTEKRLIEQGKRVKAIAIDPIIAVSARGRGVDVVPEDVEKFCETLSRERFDCLLLSNILHLAPDPEKFLCSLLDCLAPGGSVVASARNLSWPRRVSRGYRLRGQVPNPAGYKASGMHNANGSALRRWFRAAGLMPMDTSYDGHPENPGTRGSRLYFAKPVVAAQVYLRGIAAGSHPSKG